MWDHPGIGRYLRELSRRLLEKTPPDWLCLLGRSPQSHRKLHSPIYSLREQFEVLLAARDLPVLHVPHFNIPVMRKKKLVVTIHDLIYVREPKASKSRFGQSYARWLMKTIARRADAVLTVSEFTRKDLLEAFPEMSPDRVFTTPEAASRIFRPIRDAEALGAVRKKYSLQAPFVLFVGSLKPHKNLPALVGAMSRLREEKKLPHELVLVGRGDMKNKPSFVRHWAEVPDEDLACVYNLAQLLVLPSFWEGFGLPVLEAMACGTPVIASNCASLPEVAGEAALLFDPLRIDALAELIYNVLEKKELREKMRRMGIEQARLFSWEKTADITLRVYRQVLEG